MISEWRAARDALSAWYDRPAYKEDSEQRHKDLRELMRTEDQCIKNIIQVYGNNCVVILETTALLIGQDSEGENTITEMPTTREKK